MQKILSRQNKKNCFRPQQSLSEDFEVSWKINLIYIGNTGIEKYEETGKVVEHWDSKQFEMLGCVALPRKWQKKPNLDICDCGKWGPNHESKNLEIRLR